MGALLRDQAGQEGRLARPRSSPRQRRPRRPARVARPRQRRTRAPQRWLMSTNSRLEARQQLCRLRAEIRHRALPSTASSDPEMRQQTWPSSRPSTGSVRAASLRRRIMRWENKPRSPSFPPTALMAVSPPSRSSTSLTCRCTTPVFARELAQERKGYFAIVIKPVVLVLLLMWVSLPV